MSSEPAFLLPAASGFLLTQTLLGEERRKRITEKTDVVSGERRRQRGEGKEVKSRAVRSRTHNTLP